MKIPRTFMPEKNLEKKIKTLSKENYKRSNTYPEDPSFEELSERTRPVFESIAKTVYGKQSSNIIKLTDMPKPYMGWIDSIIGNYEPKSYYFTLFDEKSRKGVELKDKFLKSYKGNNVYDFKPHKQFSVKGKLIKEDYTNGFWWFIITADEVYKK